MFCIVAQEPKVEACHCMNNKERWVIICMINLINYGYVGNVIYSKVKMNANSPFNDICTILH